VIGGIRVGIGHFGEHPGADEPLALAILGNLVRNIDIEAVAKQPSGPALAVADQPPVFHHRRRGFRQDGSGAGLGLCPRCRPRNRSRRLRLLRLRRWFGSGLWRQRRGLTGDPWHRGADQELDLCVSRQQIEVLRFAAGEDVHVEIVAKSGGCGHGIVFVRFRQLLKPFVGLAVDNGALFNPAYLALFRLYLEEAAAAFENLERLPVHDLGHTFRNSGHAVVEVHLPRGDVDGVVVLRAKAAASGDQPQNAQDKEQKNQP